MTLRQLQAGGGRDDAWGDNAQLRIENTNEKWSSDFIDTWYLMYLKIMRAYKKIDKETSLGQRRIS